MLPLLLLCSGVLFLFLCANAGMHVYELIKLNDGDGGSAPPPVESNDPTCKAVADAVGSASASRFQGNTVFGRLSEVKNLLTGDTQNTSSLFGKVNFVRNASERMTAFIDTFNTTNLLLLAQALTTFSKNDGFNIINITKHTKNTSDAIGAWTDTMATNTTVFGKLATIMSDVNVSATRVQNATINAIEVMNSTLRNALTNGLNTIASSASATNSSLTSLNSMIGSSNDTAATTSTLFGKLMFIVNEVNASATNSIKDVTSTLKSELSNVSSTITVAVSNTTWRLSSLIGASNDTAAENTTIFGKLAAVERDVDAAATRVQSSVDDMNSTLRIALANVSSTMANSAHATTSSLALINATLAGRNDIMNITIGASTDTAETNSTVFGRLAAIAKDVSTSTTRIENVTDEVQRLNSEVAYLNESVSRLGSAADIGMAFTFTNMCIDTNFSDANCDTSISSWVSYNNHSKEDLCFNIVLRANTVKQEDGNFTVPTFRTTLSNNTFTISNVSFAEISDGLTLRVNEVLVYTDHDSLFHRRSPSCSNSTAFPYLITRHLFAF